MAITKMSIWVLPVNRFTGAARAVTLSVPHQRWMAGQFEARIEAFVAHYNHLRYHESIDNLTPAGVYFGRGQTILLEREGSNAKPSNTDACITKLTQPKIKPDAPESPLD
jgi:hypothetical protein